MNLRFPLIFVSLLLMTTSLQASSFNHCKVNLLMRALCLGEISADIAKHTAATSFQYQCRVNSFDQLDSIEHHVFSIIYYLETILDISPDKNIRVRGSRIANNLKVKIRELKGPSIIYDYAKFLTSLQVRGNYITSLPDRNFEIGEQLLLSYLEIDIANEDIEEVFNLYESMYEKLKNDYEELICKPVDPLRKKKKREFERSYMSGVNILDIHQANQEYETPLTIKALVKEISKGAR